MKPAQIILVALLALTAVTCVDQAYAAPQSGLNSDLKWHSDIEQAKAIAAREDKLVLLHFGASWCRPCKSIETFVFTSKEVQDTIAAHVVPVKLDADVAIDAVNEYDVQMVPYDVVITPSGRVVSKRRSPKDADNYVRMITKFSTANRKLRGDNQGNLAHQMKDAQNRLANRSAIQKGDFRPTAPQHEFGLSKDGSLLSRRQSAFGENSNAKQNPWVAPKTPAPVRNQAQTWESSRPNWDDMDRQQFLNQQQEMPVQGVARRAEPQRILNPSYFDAIRERKEIVAQTLPSRPAATEKSFEIVGEVVDAELPVNGPQLTGPVASSVSNQPYDLTTPASIPSEAELSLPGLAESSTPTASVANPPPATAPTAQPANFNVANKLQGPARQAQTQAQTAETMAPKTAMKKEPEPLDRSRYCLYGKCPVTLIKEGRWVDGDPAAGPLQHRDRVFLFADAEKRKEFKMNPDQLSPLLAGFDPVVYHEQAQLTDGKPEHGVFMGQAPKHRVILFSSAETREKFQGSPSLYLGTVRQAMQQANTGSDQTIVR